MRIVEGGRVEKREHERKSKPLWNIFVTASDGTVTNILLVTFQNMFSENYILF